MRVPVFTGSAALFFFDISLTSKSPSPFIPIACAMADIFPAISSTLQLSGILTMVIPLLSKTATA